MTNSDFIPRGDGDFNDWQKNFISLVNPNLPAWAIPATAFAALTPLQTAWTNSWNAASNKKNRTPAQTEAKILARKPFEKAIRKFIRQWIAFNSSVTDDQRRQMSLHVSDTTRTRVATPAMIAPSVTVDKVAHLLHKLRMVDPGNPKTRGKPKGMRAIQVYRFIGTAAPADSSAYQHLGDATKFSYVSNFADAGVLKKAWYIVRYVNSRGEAGPFSDAVSAAIA
jgi:hypothetical protein